MRFLLGSSVLFLCAAMAPGQGEYPLTTGPIKRYGSNQLHHGSRIQCLLFAPKGAFPEAKDESLLIAAGGNDPIRIWNPATGQRVRNIDMPWTQALAWKPEHASFVAGNAFRSLRIVQAVGADGVKHDTPAGLRTIAATLDGKTIIAGCQDGQLLVFHPATRNAVHVLGHNSSVNALAVAPDGKLIASGGGDRGVVVWRLAADGASLEKVKTFVAPGMVNGLAFLPDGKTLVSAGDDRSLRLWDLETGRIAQSLDGHDDSVVGLALSPDGKTLVSTSHDRTAIVWDAGKRAKLRTIPLRFGDVDALALSPDGKLLAVGGNNGVIRLFEIDTGKERNFSAGPQAPLAKVVQFAGKLATLSAVGDVHLWEPKTAAIDKSWTVKPLPHVQQELFLVAAPDGKTLLAGSSAKGEIEIWDDAGKPLAALPLPAKETLSAVAFAPGGKTLGLGFRSGLVQLLDWPARQVRVTTKAAGPVRSLAFAGDAPVLAAATGAKVQIFDVPTGQALRHFTLKDDVPENVRPKCVDLAFSPDGKTLAAAGDDGVVRLFDWTTGKFAVACEGHKSMATSIAFSPDGRLLASASHDKTVRLWETFTGSQVETFRDHDGPVVSVAFAPNGRGFWSAGADGRAIAWDPSTLVFENPKFAQLDADNLALLWKSMSQESAHAGQGAAWRFVAAPKDALPFLASKVALIDPKKVDQHFVDLDAREFLVREKAMRELERLGHWMEGRIETALKDPPSLEAKRRLDGLLARLRNGEVSLKQERLRTLRVLQILEQIADPASMKLLEDLSRGAAEPDLQREAELAIKRVQRSTRNSK